MSPNLSATVRKGSDPSRRPARVRSLCRKVTGASVIARPVERGPQGRRIAAVERSAHFRPRRGRDRSAGACPAQHRGPLEGQHVRNGLELRASAPAIRRARGNAASWLRLQPDVTAVRSSSAARRRRDRPRCPAALPHAASSTLDQKDVHDPLRYAARSRFILLIQAWHSADVKLRAPATVAPPRAGLAARDRQQSPPLIGN